MGHDKLKTVQNTCFSITHGLGSFSRKVSFLSILDPDDPFGHPPVSVSACSLLKPTGPRYGGVGVRLGNSEGWKPLIVLKQLFAFSFSSSFLSVFVFCGVCLRVITKHDGRLGQRGMGGRAENGSGHERAGGGDRALEDGAAADQHQAEREPG